MRSSLDTLDESSPRPSEELEVGAAAGPWIVERELGRGGMGTVYAVFHERIGKRAALKILHRGLVAPGVNAERMLLEAQVVNRIGHPNIVDIFETGRVDDGRPYIVMERLDGYSLHERPYELSHEQAIAILLQVCDALIAAHAAGVVHRDLKPDNIFLVDNPADPRRPRVKLLDWGIARIMDRDPRFTIEGQLVGTPHYLAPEQARAAEVSTATDVYSLGVVAFELFLDRLPFDAETTAEIMAMHLRAPPPPPSELWPDIPRSLDALLRQMLAKLPDQRPAMREVASALVAAQAELEQRRRRPLDVIALEPAQLAASGSALGSSFSRKLAARRRWQATAGIVATLAAISLLAIGRLADTRRPGRTAPPAVKPVADERVVVAPADAGLAPIADPSSTEPVLERCADPDVLRSRGRWYMTCTGRRGGNVFPIYASPDLRDWQRVGWIFPAGSRPRWASGNYWAPELRETADGFAAYFSMRVAGGRNAIGVATARTVTGPYEDRGSPLFARDRGASDAHVLQTTAGARYLYYRLEGERDSIWVVPLDSRGLEVRGATTRVLAATEPWERGIVEAPWVLERGGHYYLFYSGARYCDAEYAVGVARATSPLGPFEKLPQPILASGARWLGPGHVSVVDREDALLLVHHAYRATEGTPSCAPTAGDNNQRHAVISRLELRDGWPRVVP